MLRSQRGLSLFTVLFAGAFLGCVFLVVMKVIPAFSEYAGVKSAVTTLAKNNASAPIPELRELFGRRAQIENISAISGADLDIVQDKSGTQIIAAYDKEVPLIANVSFLFHFRAEAKGGGQAN